MMSCDALTSVGWLAFFLLLLRLSYDDVRVGMLYDRWVMALALVGAVLVCLGRCSTVASSFAGAAVGGGLLFVVRWLSRGGLGGGDVKLAAALGIWTGLTGIIVALFVAFVLGSLWGIVQLLCGKGKDAPLPFGPCLAVGGIVGVFFDDAIASWYEAWFW